MYTFNQAIKIKNELDIYAGKPISKAEDSHTIDRIAIIDLKNKEIDLDNLSTGEMVNFNTFGNIFRVWLIQDLDINDLFKDSREFCDEFNINIEK